MAARQATLGPRWWEPPADERESFTGVPEAADGNRCQRLWRLIGPGIMIAMAYIDPGNYATDLSGGSRFKYRLLWSVLFAHILGFAFQVLVVHMSLGTGRNLSEECALEYPRLRVLLWLVTEAASVASDLGYVMGTATAFKIFFNMPLKWGVLLAACDTLLFMALQALGHRKLEFVCTVLGLAVTCCCIAEFALAAPPWSFVKGFVPFQEGFPSKPDRKDYIIITTSIIGASVCPPNFFLHSALVQTRRFEHTDDEAVRSAQLRKALKYNAVETGFAIVCALLINCIVLIIVGQKYYNPDNPQQVDDLTDMANFLENSIGKASKFLFGFAILLAGQAASVTGTLASQFILEGFMNVRIKMWIRRLATRMVSVVPAFFITLAWGDKSAAIIDDAQVVVNFAVPFCLIPIVKFVSSRKKMGAHAISRFSTAVLTFMMICVTALNLGSAIQSVGDTGLAGYATAGVLLVPYVLVLAYLAIKPATQAPSGMGLAAPLPSLQAALDDPVLDEPPHGPPQKC